MSTWSKPNGNTVKVNVKGVFNRGEMKAAVGCVMRCSRGNWIKGMKSMIGLAVPETAELWSMFYGLKMAWENEEKSVVLESSCASAVERVLNPDPSFVMAELVQMIKQLMSEDWESCELVLVESSANLAANALANNAIRDHGGIVDLNQPPANLRNVLAADRRA